MGRKMLPVLGVIFLCLFIWGTLRLIRVMTVDRVATKSSDSEVTVEMQQAISEALQLKYSAVKCLTTNRECEDRPGKVSRTIELSIDDRAAVDNAVETILRDLLRWFNLQGLSCGRYLVKPRIDTELSVEFRRVCAAKVGGHERVVAMKRVGFEIAIEPRTAAND